MSRCNVRGALARLAAVGAAVALGPAAVGPADAEDDLAQRFYLKLETGASFTTAGNRAFGSLDQGSSYLVGVGVGYRYTPHFRADTTFGYRGDYGFNVASAANPSAAAGAPTSARADLETFTGLINGYYDVGTWSGFTPYVGAGFGASGNHYNKSVATVTGFPAPAVINGHTTLHLAWQVGAGVAYRVTPEWALEFGYRYLDLGTAQTGDTITINGVGPTRGATIKGDLQAHEAVIALRYGF